MHTVRISHPAFSGALRDQTLRFYGEILGMETVLFQDNLDFPDEDHFFFHVGGDNFIAYFLPKPGIDPASYVSAQPGSGWMDHLAIDVETGSLDQWGSRLGAAGVAFDGPVHRGYERSIYFKDPNGVTIELLEWMTAAPKGLSLAAVLREAQVRREARAGTLIEDGDVREAIAALSAPIPPAVAT